MSDALAEPAAHPGSADRWSGRRRWATAWWSRWSPVRIGVDPTDGHRWLLPATGAFVVGGIVLRIVGLPPIDLHGPQHYLGIMDPLCGGTRGTLALAHGDLAGAWRFNPLVPAIAAAAVVAAVRWAFGRATGRWIGLRVKRRRPVVIAVAVMVATLWGNQQLNADLLAGNALQRTEMRRGTR